ncbi:hypothetical protein V8G54_027344 [Vigna mungo]|uniref:Uncharacterized protein n=1 Tax=Vigna mungo TaxID=3915 RepID=A0AAQ3N0K0_VIGMU
MKRRSMREVKDEAKTPEKLWYMTLAMAHGDIVLHHKMLRGRNVIDTVGYSIASGEPEHAGATHDGQFSVLLRYGVPAEHAQGASGVVPFRESEIDEHVHAQVVERGEAKKPLGPPNGLGAEVRAFRHGIVHDESGAEAVGDVLGGVHDLHDGGVVGASKIMVEEVKVGLFLRRTVSF